MVNTRKTAIVTGASQGIGAGLVEAFLKRGYSVVANSRNSPSTSATFAAAANGFALVANKPAGRRKDMNERNGRQAQEHDRDRRVSTHRPLASRAFIERNVIANSLSITNSAFGPTERRPGQPSKMLRQNT
jgi:NAD(P)-dependent dehydrogenase (short-subunit alcohol dehydrogenase family)